MKKSYIKSKQGTSGGNSKSTSTTAAKKFPKNTCHNYNTKFQGDFTDLQGSIYDINVPNQAELFISITKNFSSYADWTCREAQDIVWAIDRLKYCTVAEAVAGKTGNDDLNKLILTRDSNSCVILRGVLPQD